MPISFTSPTSYEQLIADTEVSYIDGLIADFRQKLTDFNQLYAYLKTNQNVARDDPSLAIEVQSLIGRGDVLQSTIKSANDAIDQMFSGSELFGLGVLPFLLIAVITSAVTVLGVWISDAYVEVVKVSERKELLAAGADPTTVARAAAGGFAGFGTLGLVAVAALGLWWFSSRG